MQAPRKPWEKRAAPSGETPAQPTAATEGTSQPGGEAAASSLPVSILDQEFPPVEDDAAGEGSSTVTE